MWWMFLFGCTPEPVVLQAPDPVRTGMEGEDGPFGAGRLSVNVQARVIERLSYAVYFPADASGDPHPDLTAVPVLAWVQGGLVPTDQYEWLPQHWATRGFVTVVPDHEFDLAITQPSNAPLALDHLLRERPLGELTTDRSPLGLGGHSLGGVVAAIDWASNPDVAWLLMAASFPAAGTPVEDRGGPVLGLVGDQDGLLTPDEMRDERPPLSAAVEVEIGGREATTAREQEQRRDSEQQRRVVQPLIHALTTERLVRLLG